MLYDLLFGTAAPPSSAELTQQLEEALGEEGMLGPCEVDDYTITPGEIYYLCIVQTQTLGVLI